MTVDMKDVTDGKKSAFFENETPSRIAQALQAMAIDGSKIAVLNFELDYKTEGIVVGKEDYEMPSLFIHFYDDNRKDFEQVRVGPWLGTSGDWRTVERTVTVSPKAREMILRVGLNGATGKLWVDNVKMSFKPR